MNFDVKRNFRGDKNSHQIKQKYGDHEEKENILRENLKKRDIILALTKAPRNVLLLYLWLLMIKEKTKLIQTWFSYIFD